MKEKSEKTVADRRSFLGLVGATTVAGGAALLSSNEPAKAELAEENSDSLYRETKHIRTYYDLARF